MDENLRLTRRQWNILNKFEEGHASTRGLLDHFMEAMAQNDIHIGDLITGWEAERKLMSDDGKGGGLELTSFQLRQLEEMILEGSSIIPAIKEHRAMTGWGLKESKEAVEAIRDRLSDDPVF